MTRRPWLVGVIVTLVFGGIVHLGLELLDLRACEPGDQRCVDVQRLFHIEDLLEIHPFLHWRQRPYLDVQFEGTRVVTDKRGFRVVPERRVDVGPGADVTVVAFGASPDFGYGVEAEQAWPAIVHDLFQADGLGARVVNAGEIGYSSLQGTRLFDITKRLFKIDVAVFSYVVNDVEQLRFFFANGRDDLSTVLPTSAQSTLRNALTRLQPFTALRRVAARYARRAVGGDAAREMLERASVRTLPSDYEVNLRGLVKRARHEGIQPVFLVMPFRLPQPVPDEPPQVDAMLDESDRLLAAGDAAAALTRVDLAVATDPISRRGWRIKGLCHQALGQHDEADRAFVEATRHIIHACVRAARDYNDIMRRVAAQTDTPLVDVTPLLGDDAANMELYVKGDYVHPNAKGHRLMAKAVADVVGPLLRARRVRTSEP